MKTTHSSEHHRPQRRILLSAFLALIWTWAGMVGSARGDEFPALCSKADGGQGNTSTSGINFGNSKAHMGDTVQLFPVLGMVVGACQAQHATGQVYIASGLLVTFLNDVTLNPGVVYDCPTNVSPPCTAGPYNVTITPALVGIGVSSPGGSIGGVANTVRAIQWSFSDQVRTGNPEETLDKFDTASITIVTPCIGVVKNCNFPVGRTCFGTSDRIAFTGYVTNCGDITLTNVTAVDSRVGPLILVDPNTGLPLNPGNPTGPVSLAVGAYATYTNSFVPTLAEICAGLGTNTVVAMGTDTSDIGGPRASVTNSATAQCPICVTNGIAVTKQCPTNAIQPGGLLTFTGYVTNLGNLTLTNVIVYDDQPVPGTIVIGPITLPPNSATAFSASYTVPADSCGPYVDTLTARGTTQCGINLTNTAQAVCPGTNSPSIAVTKSCPPAPVQPGQVMNITGTVTNTGNITLTNVTVTNVIAAIGQNHLVLGPVTLAPGAGTIFSDSYVVPLDSCGPYADTVVAYGSDKCFGRVVTNAFTVACPGTNSPSIAVTKTCPPALIQPGQLLTVIGTVTNTGNVTLTNVTVTNAIAALGTNRLLVGPLVLAPGAGLSFTDSYVVPLDSCGPYADTLMGTGVEKCFGRVVTNSLTAFCPGTNSPSIAVTKSCPPGPIQPGQLLTITGTVTNTGNITLTNVTVTNIVSVLGTSRRVAGPLTLAPGAGAVFTDSYTAPLDSCGPYPDTVVARGSDKCFGRTVTNTFTTQCPGTNSPGIAVSKFCPQNPVPPGGLMVITGYVTNTGNITLTNVTVTNVIAAISQSHFVLGPISLAPGAVASFTDQYIVPLDSCGPYRDTVLAAGADECFGRIVTASAFRDCPGITTPRITVIKQCPPAPVPPGGLAVFSGIVSNAGNITLTNVVVVNNRPTNNTPVLGPITLSPGQAVPFTGSETVPPNCCSYFDTLTAVGASPCTGSNVMGTATAVCPTLTVPRLTVTKNCPPNPTPLGQPLVFTGIVSNAGNITLIGVTIVDNQLTNNTPVIGPITLAPGEAAAYAGSYVVPINICDTNLNDTVTARASDVCTGSNLVVTASAQCPIVALPRLALTKVCPPNPVPPGGVLTYTGSVSNAGALTITNVVVVNDRPAPNTPVLGPITLIPGQVVNFSGSYIAPYDCCGPCVDTLTATGNEFCRGSNVTATASDACPRSSTPAISVTRSCPPGQVGLGELVFVSGSVSNSGNATLGNVLVVDDQAGVVISGIALAPSESVPYLGTYLVTNCGPSLPGGVTASGSDVCKGLVVSNRFVTACSVTCPATQGVTILGPWIKDGQFTFSFQTDTNHNYTVLWIDTIGSSNWHVLTTVPGDGTVATIHDAPASLQRYYRVQTQ